MRALLLVFLAGCADYIDNPIRPLEERTTDAAPIVRLELEGVLETELPIDTPPVTWHDVICLPGEKYGWEGPGCLQGAYHTGRNEIDLATPIGRRIADSAFAHEHLHWALSKSRGNPDGAHAGPEWESLDAINELLSEMGL